MIRIYHNPRCRKSREGLAILEKSGKEFKVVEYLKDIPTKNELKDILTKLGITAEQLLRKNESVWKERYKGQNLSEDKIIEAMIENPKLIERPIVINGDKAMIGRPPSAIGGIL
ncbi:arsenate reductase (glutaredoxin) [Maribacter halichondriae]|uniref:arsenate reductase (glutaredoxin) n=1 Tax=Maribacter halichondriae TaxID=2980554 RepID=UPI002358B20C|nr:arsenate reductase (glutaredoxin) [Maribacter sp. Hal144]